MFFIPFFFLLLLLGGIGILVWLGLRKVAAHLKDNPEAARLLSEHVLTPLLTGKKKEQKPSEETN